MHRPQKLICNGLTSFIVANILIPQMLAYARLHQGLLQIYYDFCRNLKKGCEECEFADFLVEEM